MTNYINISTQDAIRLNDIMYNTYVFDGQNYLFPFVEGSTTYLDMTKNVFYVSDLMTQATTDAKISASDQAFISGLLAGQVTYDEAIQLGWIPAPSLG